MAAPIEVLPDLAISSDSSTSHFVAGIHNAPSLTWVWTFTISGTGDNAVEFTPELPLDPESSSSQTYAEIKDTREFDWPLWVTSDQIDDATTLVYAIVNPNSFQYMRLTYDYAGGGSRTITLNIKLIG